MVRPRWAADVHGPSDPLADLPQARGPQRRRSVARSLSRVFKTFAARVVILRLGSVRHSLCRRSDFSRCPRHCWLRKSSVARARHTRAPSKGNSYEESVPLSPTRVLGAILALPASVLADAGYPNVWAKTCKVSEVATSPNRVHAECVAPFASLHPPALLRFADQQLGRGGTPRHAGDLGPHGRRRREPLGASSICSNDRRPRACGCARRTAVARSRLCSSSRARTRLAWVSGAAAPGASVKAKCLGRPAAHGARSGARAPRRCRRCTATPRPAVDQAVLRLGALHSA